MKVKQENKIIIQEGEMGNIQSSLDYFLKFNIPKDARILDIGCNFGSLVFNLYKLGYKNIFGIEIDENAINRGRLFYSEIANNLVIHKPGNIPFGSNAFDVIMMFDVIEHVPDIKFFINNEVCRVLKKGGCFIFQTPNKVINIPWEIINNRSLTKWKTYHCSLQTPLSLKNLLTKSGFSNIIIEKGNILTQHNKNKVWKKAGLIGVFILYFLQICPVFISPNLWGKCKK